MARHILLAFAFVLLTAAGCTEQPRIQAPVQIGLELIVDGLDDPVFVAEVPGQPGKLAVVEQPGRIRIVQLGQGAGTLLDAPLLDIRPKVMSGGEQGLLGLAFAPDFADNGHFFVNYIAAGRQTHIERYTVGPDGTASPESAVLILSFAQPYSNHNGGMLAFGPDGHLYIGTGDGGSGGDPQNRAQDRSDLLGKILRIQPNMGEACNDQPFDLPSRDCANHSIPSDNPFADGRDGAHQVWAYGLRNPWRFSFDRETGDLWIGDVGQNAWEEVNLEPRGSGGGRNYGWSAWEGNHRYDEDREAPGHVPPVIEYRRAAGSCAVTGGYVYRGAAMPDLQGTYLFADYCSGDLWAANLNGTQWEAGVVLETDLSVSSFGEDAGGELYVVDLEGSVHRIGQA